MAIVLGPIVGAVDQTSAKIWLKTDTTARFVMRCTDEEGNQHESNAVETKPDADYTGVAELTGLLPDKEYHYSIDIDGEEIESLNFRFRTAPEETKDFWFVFGSCFRPCVHYTFVMQELYRRCHWNSMLISRKKHEADDSDITVKIRTIEVTGKLVVDHRARRWCTLPYPDWMIISHKPVSGISSIASTDLWYSSMPRETPSRAVTLAQR